MRSGNRPQRQQIPTSDSSLTVVVCDDESRTLRCNHREVTWHSESGALAESQLVFLENSGVAASLRDSAPVAVLEVGFGTGLNFWLTASLALRNSSALEYVAYEPQPLDVEIIESLQYSAHESCRAAIENFQPVPGVHEVDQVSLHFVEQTIQDMDATSVGDVFDAIYHDPFGPEAAPELWSAQIFGKLLTVLKPGGRLVTYCVKSEVQKRLRDVGYAVSKTRGPVGGKREVLIAEKV